MKCKMTALIAIALVGFNTGCGGSDMPPVSAPTSASTYSITSAIPVTSPLPSTVSRGAYRVGVKGWGSGRAVLTNAESVKFTVTAPGYEKSAIVNRDGGLDTAEFLDVPVGTIRVNGEAFALRDGGGEIKGSGSATVEIVAGVTTEKELIFSETERATATPDPTGTLVIYAVDGGEPGVEPEPSPLPKPSPTVSASPEPSPSPSAATEIELFIEPNLDAYKRGRTVRPTAQLIRVADGSLLTNGVVEFRAYWDGGPASGKFLKTLTIRGKPVYVSYRIPNDETRGIIIEAAYKGGSLYAPATKRISIPIQE